MKIRLIFLVFFLFLSGISPLFSQYTTIFVENFESCPVGNLPQCGWSHFGSGTLWRITNSACTITGNYSLAVGSDAVDCQYNIGFDNANRTSNKSFSSAGYQLLDISFDWKSDGESNIDYGLVVYSADGGFTWNPINATRYQGSPGTQSVTNLTLPVVLNNLALAYIGFQWLDDANGLGAFPGFTIDNIQIRGEQMIPNDPPNPLSISAGCDSALISWNGTPPSPSNVVWYWQGTSCGTSTSLGSGSTYIALTSGTYYIRAFNTVSNLWSSSCGSVTVTVDGPPPVPDAGPSGNECDKDYLFAAVPSVGTGTWTQIAGPGISNFINQNDPGTQVSVTDFGSYIYEWTEQNGNCVGSDTLIVRFNQTPTANAGNDVEVCGLNANLNALPSSGTGTWAQVSGPGTATFSNAGLPNTPVSVTASGVYDLSWTENNNGCLSSDNVTITFDAGPTPNAGADGMECDFDYIFSAVPSLGTGTWSQLFGPGSSFFSNTSDPACTVTVSMYGTYIFKWEETNGICTGYDYVTVNFFAPPLADAGPDDNICDTTYKLNAVPAIGNGTWSQVTGPGTATFDNSSNPLANVTVDATGVYVLVWTMNNNGCISTDTIQLTFIDPPLANAGLDGNECDKEHTFNAIPSVGTGTWTMVFGPGTATFTGPNNPNGSVSVSNYGTYIFRWTEDNGLCSAYDDVSVNFFMLPNSDAGFNDTACGLTYSLVAFPSIGSGQWSFNSGPGTALFTNPNSFNSYVTVDSFGLYVFQWKETNGTCSDSDTVAILFGSPPVPYAGEDDNICGQSYSLIATSIVGTGLWTQIFGGGVATFTPTPPVNPVSDVSINQYGSYVFRWTESNGACTAYDEVGITFWEQPVAFAGLEGTVCDSADILVATQSVGLGTWSQYSGPGTSVFTGAGSPTTGVYVSIYGTYVYQWTEINGICFSSDTVTEKFFEQPVANAGTGGKECDTVFVCNAVASVGTGLWSTVIGTGNSSFANPNNDTTNVSIANTGTYIFRWTETNGICFDYEDILVNFYAKPLANAGNDTTISLGDVAYLNGMGGDLYLWSPDSTLTGSAISNPVADPVQTQTYQLEVTSLYGCKDTDEIVITVVADHHLKIAEVITPNGDGFNDIWYVDNIEFYTDCEVTIFNRYGNVVYQKKGYTDDWDGKFNGKMLPHGSYYYAITCPGYDKTWTGTITIVK